MYSHDVKIQVDKDLASVAETRPWQFSLPRFFFFPYGIPKWQDSSPLASCMYGVPEKLRKPNKEAYIPQAVVIGPIHRKNKELMQLNKKHYYDHFFNPSPWQEKSKLDRIKKDRDQLEQKARELAQEARKCYQFEIGLEAEPFVTMLLVDGIFILEFLLRKCSLKRADHPDERNIFEKPSLRGDILYDLILIENQLPFFVLKGLYETYYNSSRGWEEFLYKVANEYFTTGVTLENAKTAVETCNIRHLADFLHALCMVSISSKYKNCYPKKFDQFSRSATELRKAGVQFEKADNNLPFDVVFSKDEGVLKFPPLVVNRWTEYFFRNFIAHEDHIHTEKIISSYIILMGSLLNSSEDVDLLVARGIIENKSLRTSEEVSRLIKNLYNRSMMCYSDFFYASLCDDLNKYSKDDWHRWRSSWYKWKEILKSEYFSSPWSIISVIVAFVILLLTLIQTASSVIPYFNPGWSKLG
ncbi:hypothetical protein L1049_018093 [Liquidambar formosana]|uniref:Uncharacterized protein n=1 Tax=Liquidambar formosana TaxID=63359 RepID=A0AAP0R9N5_LIQFO